MHLITVESNISAVRYNGGLEAGEQHHDPHPGGARGQHEARARRGTTLPYVYPLRTICRMLISLG